MRSQHPKSIQKLFPALGTLNAVTVYDTDTDTATDRNGRPDCRQGTGSFHGPDDVTVPQRQ